ncbi:MAG: glycosyltransferase family 4 protein [Acidimicrobiia bacterium]|nr:glycosyltransferase family 4 protein [Acidimicrobiia bacterium]
MKTDQTRIVHIQPVAERGGSDQALLGLIRSLDAKRFRSSVVVPAPSPLAARYEAVGARVHVVPMRRLTQSEGVGGLVRYALAWPVTVVRLTLLARRLGADVVHTNSLHSLYGWAVALLLRIPHVWHAREIVVQSSAALRLERLLARHFATRVIAISDAVAAQLDPRNVVVVYDSPDLEEFRPERAGHFRPGASLPDTAPVVGFLGRIDTWKGVDVLLDAFGGVRHSVEGARLVVAGPDVPGKEDYAEDLRRRAGRIEGVTWLGACDVPPDFLADVDVLAVPSTSPEPYGLVVAEALASGVPVVVTADGGAEEIVAGLPAAAAAVVPRGDAGALAAACVHILGVHLPTSAARRSRRPRLLAAAGSDFDSVFTSPRAEV